MKLSALTSPTAPEPAAALRQALLSNRVHALTELYRDAFPAVRRHVRRRGGTDPDAQDVFQDALVVLFERAVNNRLVLTASASSYLLGVARNLWRREVERRSQRPLAALAAEHEQAAAEIPADPLAETADPPAVRDYVERLGEKCKAILLSFYYFQEPLEQIAGALGYGSVRSATVQKFKCLERLRKAVRAVFQPENLAR